MRKQIRSYQGLWVRQNEELLLNGCRVSVWDDENFLKQWWPLGNIIHIFPKGYICISIPLIHTVQVSHNKFAYFLTFLSKKKKNIIHIMNRTLKMATFIMLYIFYQYYKNLKKDCEVHLVQPWFHSWPPVTYWRSRLPRFRGGGAHHKPKPKPTKTKHKLI